MISQTLDQLARAKWNIGLDQKLSGRFAESGWYYECAVDNFCTACATPLEVFRKPYVSAGKKMKYVALVCIDCPRVLTMQDLGVNTFAKLTPRTPSQAKKTPTTRSDSAPVRSVPASGKPEDIIRFWRSVEYFECQTIDYPGTDDLAQGIAAKRFRLSSAVPAPWFTEPKNRPSAKSTKVAHYTVNVGLFRLDAMHSALVEVLGEGGQDVDERTPRGSSALFSMGINRFGHAEWDSLVIASAPWALGQVLRSRGSGRMDLNGFEQLNTDLAMDLAAEYGAQRGFRAHDENPEPAALDAKDLLGMVNRAATFLGISEKLCPRDVVVTKQMVASDEKQPQTEGFLNSFLAEDLERVAADVAGRGPKGALRAYLAAKEPRRFDTSEPGNRAAVEEKLEPRNIPAGRWPTEVKNSLSTSQQLAVNSICRGGSDGSSVFGVNGPPGTGKTTLLRDIVAEQVTQRAAALAALSNPESAFTGEWLGWTTDKFKFSFPRLNPAITGWEMVVASSNNGAVENVSRELPRTSELDERWHGRSYLSHAAGRLDPGFWGLLSGVLGASSKRREFRNRVWWGEKEDRGESTGPAMDTEMTRRMHSEGETIWNEALAGYRRAQAREESIRNQRQELCEALLRLPEDRRKTKLIDQELSKASTQYGEILVRAQDAQKSLETAESRLSESQREQNLGLEAKPNWWESLWDFGAALRAWRLDFAGQQSRYRTCRDHLVTAKEFAQLANDELSHAVHGVEQLRGELADRRAQITRVEARSAAAQTHNGIYLPDQVWWEDKNTAELRCPWLDAEWNEARSELFLASLTLHEAFMVRTWKSFAKGLRAAMELLGSKAPDDVPEHVVTEAWRYLFLMVPLVSTTFASLGRMFEKVSPRSLGWLVIDEAGQATPQAAVGGIWRSRNVVAVGDPLQLEPIVAALHSTQAQLRDTWNVDEVWMPASASVQRLADRVTPIGTYLPGQVEPLWTGAPLRAHRRCDDPMFSVINQAVYGGAMVQGPPTRNATEPLRTPQLPDNAWIEVPGTTAQGKWRPDEGIALLELVRGLLAVNLSPMGENLGEFTPALRPEDILVISPFKQASEKARALLASSGLAAGTPQEKGFTVGTVHTAQGKEAKVVIFVLGSDPAKPGARAWASEKPNLLNVAVSRAKHRIFVIGQRSEWSNLPYFGDLAAAVGQVPASDLETYLTQ